MEYLSLLPATALGYWTFRLTTHPNARIRKKMPNLKLKRLQLFPVISFHIFGKNIHFHHWMNLSLLLAVSGLTQSAILDHNVVRALMVGGVIQGLTLPKGHKAIFSCSCSNCKKFQLN